MVRNDEAYLRKIFEGKIKCERHEAYKAGGNRKSKHELYDE